jgi:hypothetical protein
MRFATMSAADRQKRNRARYAIQARLRTFFLALREQLAKGADDLVRRVEDRLRKNPQNPPDDPRR